MLRTWILIQTIWDKPWNPDFLVGAPCDAGADHPRTTHWKHWRSRRSRQTLLREGKKKGLWFTFSTGVIYNERTQKISKHQPSPSPWKHTKSISVSGKKRLHFTGKFCVRCKFGGYSGSFSAQSSSCDQVSQDSSVRVQPLSQAPLSCSENKPTESTWAIFTPSERLSILEIAAGNSDIW